MEKKRVTVRLKTPNPLFEKWLREWREKAKQQNSKMEYTFKLALQSLEKYPVPLHSGRECKILKGFGDKLCLMIDNKLKECRQNGYQVEDIDEILPVTTAPKTSQRKKMLPQTKKEHLRSPKSHGEYIPQYRSGAYAILIALYQKSLESDYPGFLRKDAIIEAAQFLTDSSFIKPAPGSRYTAWSSMKTLLNKELVVKQGNPSKFSLTDTGTILARKLLESSKLTSDSKFLFNSSSEDKVLSDDNKNRKIILLGDSDDESEKVSFNKFKSWTSSSSDVGSLSADSCVTVYSSKTVLSKPNVITKTQGLLNTSNTKSQLSLVYSKFSSSSVSVSDAIVGYSTVKSTGSINNDLLDSDTLNKQTLINKTKLLSSATEKKSKAKTISKTTSSSSNWAPTESGVEEETIIFLPHNFDIILYVDLQEVTGKKHEEMLKELQHLSVVFEVKHLKVGDFTWICRDRETKKELVLPYIVERKRMDDFGKSITDGRYYEQKFRLKKSGIENVIYLIESYGKNDTHLGLPLSTLMQAATNTAIQDFFVKFTRNLSETAQYLACFSKKLINLFESRTVISCPKENLSSLDFEDDLLHLMTFQEFNKSSLKNKRPEVSDLFVKMLIQLKGMSVDRALAIVHKYPTPALLQKAYEDNSIIQGEKLLANIKFGTYNKSIGLILSKTIYQLFTKVSFII